jgi:phospholipid/cholesterol/gamma-HCH transport system substrate-binding protein
MSDNIKNVIIGIFSIAAIAIVIFILMFLHPKTGDEGETIYVRFTDIDKVNVGTRVSYSGRPVGEVVEIRELPYGRDGPKDSSGHVYTYELKLLIDSGINIYDTDEITLRTSGLLGERSVAIIPLAPKPGETPRLIDNEILYAQEVGSVEQTMAEFKEVADRVEVTMEYVTSILKDIKAQEIVKKISVTMQNMQDITTALNKPDEWASTLNNIQDFSSTLAKRLPDSWDKVDNSLDELKAASTNTRNLTSTANLVFTDVSRGKGTAGKILVDEDLYLRLTALLNKGDTVMNDINHYGILFNTDKGWQRMRARQRNLLNRLSHPQQFRNYFNDELNQVTTSLERVEMTLEQFKAYNPDGCLYQSPEYKKVFAELLRRVSSLESELKMYDQQLMEPQIYQTELMMDCR